MIIETQFQVKTSDFPMAKQIIFTILQLVWGKEAILISLREKYIPQASRHKNYLDNRQTIVECPPVVDGENQLLSFPVYNK